MKKFSLSSENQNILCASVCAAAGFAAAYASLPGHGPVSGLCLLALCAAVCALINGHILIKLTAAPVSAGIIASVLTGSTATAAMYAAVMLLMCAVFTYTFRYAFKKSTAVKMISVVLSLAMFFINAMLCGFITDILPAQKLVDEYTSGLYNENSVISTVYYDATAGRYKCDIHASDSPTEISHINVVGGKIEDGYIGYVRERLEHVPLMKLTSVLRSAVPSGNFSVVSDGITGFPFDTADPLDTNDYSAQMSFTVKIGGMLSPDEFAAAAQKYADAVHFSDLPFCRITFTGGNGQRTLYSVTIKNGFLLTRISPSRVTPYDGIKYRCHRSVK